jgi:hypothetical protein
MSDKNRDYLLSAEFSGRSERVTFIQAGPSPGLMGDIVARENSDGAGNAGSVAVTECQPSSSCSLRDDGHAAAGLTELPFETI